MIPGQFALILALPVVAALANWRAGIYAAVVMAMLQDPIRKLLPGQPVYFVVLVGVVFAGAWLSALMAGVPLTPGRIGGWRRYLGAPFAAFCVVLGVQAAHGLVETGSFVVVGIGLLTYLAPIPAVVLGYQFALRVGPDGVRRFFLFYAACATAGIGTVYLQYKGFDWPILGEVGSGIYIYDQIVGALSSYAGIFRSSEVAAWHVATAVCVLLLLLSSRRASFGAMLIGAVVIVLLLAIGSITGRRKLFVEVAIFVAVNLTLASYFGRHAIKMAVVSGLCGALVVGYVLFFVPPDANVGGRSSYQAYLIRSGSVAGDVSGRFENLGLGGAISGFRESGLLGAGVGTGSQGAQHFGGNSYSAAEGGVGKIVVELGIPGLLAVAWFGLGLFRLLWQGLRYTARKSPELSRLAFGLTGFLVANVGAFAVAAQVFADLFVLLMLGTCLGFLLATPIMAQKKYRSVEHARNDQMAFGPSMGRVRR